MAAWLRLRRLAALGLTVLCACRVERAPSGRPGGSASGADTLASAEVVAALRLYYARMSARQWELLQRCFWPRASITAIIRNAVQTVTIEEAIKRAPTIKDCPVSRSDELARATVAVYGPLADAWVTYRARCGVVRDSVTTHYGIDAFHLMKHDGEWRIAGLTFTSEMASQPLEHQP
jgi:hypothetical protein